MWILKRCPTNMTVHILGKFPVRELDPRIYRFSLIWFAFVELSKWFFFSLIQYIQSNLFLSFLRVARGFASYQLESNPTATFLWETFVSKEMQQLPWLFNYFTHHPQQSGSLGAVCWTCPLVKENSYAKIFFKNKLKIGMKQVQT